MIPIAEGKILRLDGDAKSGKAEGKAGRRNAKEELEPRACLPAAMSDYSITRMAAAERAGHS